MALLTELQHVKHTNMFISVVLDGKCKEVVVQLVSKLRINVLIYKVSKHFKAIRLLEFDIIIVAAEQQKSIMVIPTIKIYLVCLWCLLKHCISLSISYLQECLY